MKILNNAVITKCGECPNYARFGMADCHLTKEIIFADKSGSINEKCPLQECKVIKGLLLLGFLTEDMSKKYDDIEKIIIVRREGR